MKKVLIYFSEFNRALGGGEVTPLSFIAELQRNCEVTLALNWQSDVARAAEVLGIPADVSELRIEYVKPAGRFLRKLDAILPFYRTRRLKQLAKDADLCISTVNMFDFGKPAHHFVYLLRQFGDNAFDDHLHGRPAPRGMALFRRKLRTFLGEMVLRPMLGMRSTRRILADPREHIYPTSHYVERVMKEFYGEFNSTVFYPPTLFEFSGEAPERDPLKVVVLGHLFPEKRCLEIIRIVERARDLSGLELTLSLGGPLVVSSYVEQIRAMSAERAWLSLAGPLYGEEKRKFLLSGTYAVHGERDEAFGISVTEYLKGGLVPLVPDDGGSRETVDDPELTYRTVEEGARILAHLATDAGFLAAKRGHCAGRAGCFTRQAYLKRQHELLDAILAETEKGEK